MIDRGPADVIRARLADPRDVARRLGFDRVDRQRGDGVLVCCPAHAERTPSCSLTRSGGSLRVKCHGCGWGADVFGLIAKVKGMDHVSDFPRVLAVGAALADMAPPPLAPCPQSLPPPISDDLFAIIVSRLLGLCPLRHCADVAAYLGRRGIADEAARDLWGALPAPVARLDRYSGQDRVTARLVAEFGRQAMMGSGLCVQDNEGWVSVSRPASRVLIPWRDAGGRIIGLQRRRIDAGEPRYVATAGRPLREPYGLERLAQSPRAAVAWVEGAVDALALRVLSAQSNHVDRCHVEVIRGYGVVADDAVVHGEIHHPGVKREVDHIGCQVRGATTPASRFREHDADMLVSLVSSSDRVVPVSAIGEHTPTIAHPRPLPPSFIALALPGVEGWRSAWAAYTRGRDVYVATDADDAGDRVVVTIASDCRAAGARSVQRMRPAAKDWCAVLEERRKV